MAGKKGVPELHAFRLACGNMGTGWGNRSGGAAKRLSVQEDRCSRVPAHLFVPSRILIAPEMPIAILQPTYSITPKPVTLERGSHFSQRH